MKTNPFKVLNSGALYDVASAMRGPDDDCVGLKFIFTARIRSLAGVYNEDVLLRDTKVINRDILRDAIEDIITMHKNAARHYISHVDSALQALKYYKRISKPEYKFLQHIIHHFHRYFAGYINEDELRSIERFIYYHHQPAFVR